MTRRYQRICHLPCDQVYVQWFEERCDSLRRRRLHLSWNRGHRDELGWKRVARGVTGITFGRWWMAIRRETTQNIIEKMEIIMFEIRHVDQECLVSVEGYYDVQFKTNSNTSKLMGYNKGTKFIIAKNGMKIIGFHGYVEKNLKSLGAYFTRFTPMKLHH
ncbi:hypothetical protein YC2023_075748 [Brassica napus]